MLSKRRLDNDLAKVRYISWSTPSGCEPPMNGLGSSRRLLAPLLSGGREAIPLEPCAQRMTRIYSALLLLGAPIICAPVAAADAAAGRTLFRQQCSVCHTAEPNDN